MVKRLTISFSDYCFENYLSEVYKNRSKYVESVFLRGANSMLEQTEENKSKILKLMQENNNLQEELKRLRFEVNKRKDDSNIRKLERERKVARIKGIQASGALQND